MRTAGLGPTDSRPTARHPYPGVRRLAVLGTALAGFTALAAIGDATAAVLLERQPVVLLALTPRTAYQVAVAHDVPFAVFVVVSVARLCAADPVHFHLGRTAGPAVAAAASRHPLARRWLDRFRRGRLPALRLPSPGHWLWLVGVVLSPTAKTMLLAGAKAVRPLRVAVADLAGTVARVLLVWHAGHAFPQAAELCRAAAPVLAVPGVLAAVALVASRRPWSSPGTPRPRRTPRMRLPARPPLVLAAEPAE